MGDVRRASTDQFTGFDYDLAQAIGAKLGVKFEFVKASFDSIIIGIQAGNYDIAMSGMYDNKLPPGDSRLRRLRSGRHGHPGEEGQSRGDHGLRGPGRQDRRLREGHHPGGCARLRSTRQFKAEGKPEMTVNEFPDQPARLLAVQSGKVVADLTDASTAGYIAVTTDDGATFEIVMRPEPAERLGDSARRHRRAQEQHRPA